MSRRGLILSSVAGALLFLVLSLLLFRSLERDGEFDLVEISVWGCRDVDSTIVAGCLTSYLGRPLPELSANEMEAALSAVHGIDSAVVWFELPDRAGVLVDLDDPVMVVRDGATETAMTEYCEPLPPSFLSDTLTIVVINGGRAERVLGELAGWVSEREIPGDVDSIIVEPSGAVAVIRDGMRIILGYGDFGRRLRTFMTVEGRSVVREGWVEADMRFDGQIILRETPTGPGGATI